MRHVWRAWRLQYMGSLFLGIYFLVFLNCSQFLFGKGMHNQNYLCNKAMTINYVISGWHVFRKQTTSNTNGVTFGKRVLFLFLSFYLSIFPSISLSLSFSFLSLYLFTQQRFDCFRPVLDLLLTAKYLMFSTRRVIRTSLQYTMPLYEDGYQNKKQILRSGCKVSIRSAFAARVSCRNLHFLLSFGLTSSTLLSFFAQEVKNHGI